MPGWARSAVDLIGELTPEGHYAYPVVVVLVPRQSAKTTTALDIALGRAIAHRDYRAAYAAQTGHVTTERMGERLEELGGSPLAGRIRTRRSQGTERFTLTTTGSYCKAFPPRNGALRSSALDLVIVDEGQEHDDVPLGVALDHTIMPTFTTRPRRQYLILGTAPDRPGTYLERYATLARAGTPGVALVDYGALPDEDPGDPAVWHRRHPGLAAGLTDVDYLRSQWEFDPAGFTREHLNVWPVGAVTAAVIPATDWADCLVPPADAAALSTSRPTADALAVAVAPDGARAAICAAYRLGSGVTLVKVLAEAPGTAWIAAEAKGWQLRTRRVVTIDVLGPAGPVADELRAAGVALDVVTTDGYARACAGFLADVLEHRLRHLGQPVLDAAAGTAERRPMGERWAWKRRGGDVSALEAASLAVGAARHALGKPFISTG
jgi:hypothetical protein